MAKLTSRGLPGRELRTIKTQLRRTRWAMLAERVGSPFRRFR